MTVLRDLPLAANAAIFVVSAAIVWYAGTRLAHYAEAIADRTGIGDEAIGMLLLGGVTSSPELAVAVTSALTDFPGLSVNNLLGAAAINVVVLAVADAVIGREALTSTLASPGVLLQGLLSVLLFAIVVAAVTTGDQALLGMGISSWVLLVVYVLAVRIVVRSKGIESWIPAKRARDRSREPEHRKAVSEPMARLLAHTAIAGGAIFAAGFLLARTGASLGEQTGLGTNFFGAVMLAFATTLPEMSTVYGTVRLKRYEMAISDVLGTNMFNMSIIVVVDLLAPGEPVLVHVGAFAAFGALLAIVLTTILLIGMVERRDRTVLRLGIDSIAVLGCYAAGLAVLYQLR